MSNFVPIFAFTCAYNNKYVRAYETFGQRLQSNKERRKNMAVNFVTYNTAEERLAAFRRSVSLRKEWEAKMAPAMKQYREKVNAGKK